MSELSKDSALSVLPLPIASDDHMYHLAQVNTQDQMAIHDAIPVLRIYAGILFASESLCDKLAEDFAIPWYDYNATVAKKRAVIHDCFYVRRRMGTVGAINTALAEIFNAFSLQEWFDYYGYDGTSGRAGHFRVLISETENTEEKISAAQKIINLLRPVKTVLDGIYVVERDAEVDRSRVDLCRVAATGNRMIIPDSVTVIQHEQYSGVDAEVIVCPEECTEIQSRAFADCPNLKTVVIYRATRIIASDAFEGSDTDLTIQTTLGSYAAYYASRNGYKVVF